MEPVFFYQSARSSRVPANDARWWFNVWAPVAIAILIICIESTSTFSAQNTSSWLRPIVEGLVGPFHGNGWEAFHHCLRKTGHFIGYGTVGFTFLRAWLYARAPEAQSSLLSWRVESTILAIFSTAIVASCDEFHQTFLPSRTGTPLDVLLDTAGASVLCLLVWLICWTRSSRNLGPIDL